MTTASIVSFVPKLSKAGKMPCGSFSTPAQACITGSKLAKVAGSVCFDCYALKGMYRFPNVKAPRDHNLALIQSDLVAWSASMIESIRKADKSGFFRWHDSGDLQSFDHLVAIISIANALPQIKFWLPTKEKAFLAKLKRSDISVPSNLAIRLSMPMIDQAPITSTWALTSTVHQKAEAFGASCNAYQNDGKCGDCRACWNTDITNISYPKH
jgi:hypothetical protein